MNALLKIILSLSLSGALLILALLLCKPLVKDKLSKSWQYYIWLIVVVRLLFPFAPETNLMGMIFQNLDNAMIHTNTGSELSAFPETDFSKQHNIPAQVGSDGAGPLETDKAAAPGVFEMVKQNIAVICLLVWLIVSVGLLIRKITVYQSFVKYLKAGRIEISDMQLWERVGKLMEQTGIKGTVGLYTNSLISSPLLIGFFRPCIMLPTAGLSESDFENTILHELTHYKRRDMFYKWLVQVTICLHWFNPFVYLMGREVNRACELSCNEVIIRSLNTQGRLAYGDTLLNAMGMGGKYKDSLASVTLNESTELLKERLDAIMIYSKKTKLIIAISLMLTIALACGAAAMGVYAAPTPQYSAAASISSKVVREGGVYYIFCDGADESDKPNTGVTEGNIEFVLVRKDGYTSIGPFSDITRLNDEVTEQCEYMLNAQSITQEEMNLVVEAAANVQSGNEEQYKQVLLEDEDYSKWKIDNKNGAYYYENERVRTFVDLREDSSLVNFSYDKLGTIDIRLMRGDNGDITKIEYLTETEVEEILNQYDISDSE